MRECVCVCIRVKQSMLHTLVKLFLFFSLVYALYMLHFLQGFSSRSNFSEDLKLPGLLTGLENRMTPLFHLGITAARLVSEVIVLIFKKNNLQVMDSENER